MKLGVIEGPHFFWDDVNCVNCNVFGEACQGYEEIRGGKRKRTWCSNGCLKEWLKRKREKISKIRLWIDDILEVL